MANPDPQTLTADVWNKIATAVSVGRVWFLDSAHQYYHTFRDTGDPAPAGNPTVGNQAFSDGAKRLPQRSVGGAVDISTLVSSDVYVYSTGAGRLIVEI